MDRAQKVDDIGKRNPLIAKAPHFAKGPQSGPRATLRMLPWRKHWLFGLIP